MKNKKRKIYECLRCGWKWFPIKEDVRQCPKCKTAYWNKPKKEK